VCLSGNTANNIRSTITHSEACLEPFHPSHRQLCPVRARHLKQRRYIFYYVPSSGSIVSDYGLDDRAIEVQSPTGTGFSSSPCVQTGSVAQPPIQWVPGVLSPGVKRGRGVTLTTHPHLVPRLRMSRSYTSSPPINLHGV
jgi:hypothetical protein